jgi:hypothetical protein
MAVGARLIVELPVEHVFVVVYVTLGTKFALGHGEDKFVAKLRWVGGNLQFGFDMTFRALPFDLRMFACELESRRIMIEVFDRQEIFCRMARRTWFVRKVGVKLPFVNIGMAAFTKALSCPSEDKFVSGFRWLGR